MDECQINDECRKKLENQVRVPVKVQPSTVIVLMVLHHDGMPEMLPLTRRTHTQMETDVCVCVCVYKNVGYLSDYFN